jgi:hypothetical protein
MRAPWARAVAVAILVAAVDGYSAKRFLAPCGRCQLYRCSQKGNSATRWFEVW